MHRWFPSPQAAIASLLLFLTLISSGCRKKEVIPPEVVASVGERMLTLADFKRYLDQNAGTDLSQMAPAASTALLDQFIQEVLLSQYAAKSGIDIPADQIAVAVRGEPGSTITDKRDQMRRERLIASLSASVPEPTNQAVQAYYNAHMEEFRSGEQVRVKQILVHDEMLANQIVAELSKGRPFEDLSVEHSSAPNAKRGGDIGYVAHGQLPRAFEDEIFKLRPGATSSVIKTDASFHIFKVESYRPAGPIDYQTLEPMIRTRLKSDSVTTEVDRVIAAARKLIPIIVFTKRLPFRYSGNLPVSKDE